MKGFATAEKLRNALFADLPDILKKVVESAKAGDLASARTVLERCLPPLKAVEAPVLLDGFAAGGTLTEQGRAFILAMAQGVLTPGQASQLLGALASQAKIAEVDDLAPKIAAIEAMLDDLKSTISKNAIR